MVDLNDKANEQKYNNLLKALKITNGRMEFINKKINILDSKLNAIYQFLTNGGNVKTVMTNVPNIVPNLSGTQIMNMLQMGWTIDQISYISGYSYEKIHSLYKKCRGIR